MSCLTIRRFRALSLVAAFIAGAFLSAGCSGGGGGGSGAAAVDSGTVAVLLADGPADDYDRLLIKVNEVSLLPVSSDADQEPVVLFESADGIEVDLLDLRDEDFVLTVKDDVAAGFYRGIRLRVSTIQPEGGPCDELEIHLPSGKVDLDPGGDFEVADGETLFLRLDVDADKSINFHAAGKSGRCIFRPVVFVDMKHGRPSERCLHSTRGTIDELRADDGFLDGFVLDLAGRRGDLEVNLLDDTSIFDADGRPAGPDALELGQRVGVRGVLDSRSRLDATVVVVGQVFTLEGTVKSPVELGRFRFEVGPGEEIVGDLAVELSEGTVIVAGCADRAPATAIQPGSPAQVTGKYSAGDSVLRAAMVLLPPGPRVEGDLVAVTDVSTGLQLTLVVDDGDADRESVVFAPDGVPILLEGDGPVPLELLGDLLSCRALRTRVALDPVDPNIATEVRVRADRLAGTVSARDADRGIVILEDGTGLQILDDATLLEFSDDRGRPISLERIRGGDAINSFGLAACPDDVTDFHAFVVIVDTADDDLEDESKTSVKTGMSRNDDGRASGPPSSGRTER